MSAIRLPGFRPGLRQWVSVLALGLVAVLAACDSGSGDEPTATSRPATSTAAASVTAAPSGTPGANGDVEIRVGDGGDLGEILVDGEGRTLYLFSNDSVERSNCTGGCVNTWPPLLTESSAVALEGVSAEVGTMNRGNGATQVTVNGLPVYHYVGDAAPGDTNGQGSANVWWVIDADGESVRD